MNSAATASIRKRRCALRCATCSAASTLTCATWHGTTSITATSLKQRYGNFQAMQRYLQLPEQLSASLDLATATGKSYVLYGLAAIMLAEGAVDSVLVLCPFHHHRKRTH